MRGTCSTCQARYRLPSTVHHSRVAFLSTGGFRLLQGTVVTLEAETNTRVRVCGGERESMQATAVGRRSCLSAFFFFSPPGLGAASGSAGQRVLCSPVPEKSSQAEWYRTQPDTELQMDRPTETRRNRIAVVSVHL